MMPKPWILPSLLAGLLVLVSACGDESAYESPQAPATQEVETPSSDYPIPDSAMSLHDYAAVLRAAGFDAEVTSERTGDDGHYVLEEALLLEDASLWEGYTIASVIWDLPAALRIPLAALDTLNVLPNPDKPSHLWNDDLEASRDSTGAITSIQRYIRGEGFGSSSRIDVLESGIALVDLSVAD